MKKVIYLLEVMTDSALVETARIAASFLSPCVRASR